ncbi:MAG: hypothetical protein GY711_08825 [bacterium]|nr:hypothetical protein [bacterium]
MQEGPVEGLDETLEATQRASHRSKDIGTPWILAVAGTLLVAGLLLLVSRVHRIAAGFAVIAVLGALAGIALIPALVYPVARERTDRIADGALEIVRADASYAPDTLVAFEAALREGLHTAQVRDVRWTLTCLGVAACIGAFAAWASGRSRKTV